MNRFDTDEKKANFNIKGCLKFDNKEDESLFLLMTFVEKNFKCSGMCKENNTRPYRKYYLFAENK